MEMETNYKWIVYLTTNQINNKIYVGVHKTKDPYKFDGYIGNGIYITQPSSYEHPKTYFQYAVKKYGVKNFKREIINIYDNEDDAYLLESQIVNEEFLQRKDVYNLIFGGISPTPIKIKVFQYSIKGDFITEYDSIQSAADKNNVTHGAIWHAIHSKIIACNSFWSTDKLNKLDTQLYNKGINHKRLVYVYSKDGNFIKVCNSETSAAEYCGVHISSLRQALLFGCLIQNKYKVSFVLADNYSNANTIYLLKRKIYQYSEQGVFIKEYIQQDALQKFPKSNINKSIKTKTKDFYGYYWALIQIPNFLNKENRSNSPKQVGKYTLDGNLVQMYKSATQAAKENGTSVWKVLNGTNKTHKQHIYKYI